MKETLTKIIRKLQINHSLEYNEIMFKGRNYYVGQPGMSGYGSGKTEVQISAALLYRKRP